MRHQSKLALIVCAWLLPALTARAEDKTAEAQTDAAAEEVAAADAQAAETAASAGSAAVQGAAAAADAATAPADEGKMGPDFVSDGNRVSVKDGDFTIQPPKGWEVYTHQPTLTLLMQVPHQQGMKYQRTIQVASFSDPRFIDEVTAKEYEDVIVRKFSAATVSIDGYKVRNHMPVELADGRQGLLFYTEFTLEGVNMMQAHILVSDQARHYLVTYTDLAEHFENDGASQFLTEAWDSMISVQLGSRTPARFEAALYVAVGAGILALCGVFLMLLRRWRSGRQYRDYADGRGLDAAVSTAAPESLAASSLSGFSDIKSDVKTGVTGDLASVHSLTEAPKKKVAAKQKHPGKAAKSSVPATSMPDGTLPEASLVEESFDTQDDIAI